MERFDSIPDDGTVMTSQLKEVGVKFNKPIVASTFTKDDITLNCQGVQADLSQAAIRQVSDTEYVISLGEATIESGYYVLTVMTDGITDSEGFAGYSGKNTSWTQYIDGKVAVELTASPEEGGKVSPVTGRFEYGKEISLKATPAEGTTYRLAKEDQKRYPDILQAGTKEAPYYTNSSQLPVGFTDDPFTALNLQESLQSKYTGGTVMHLYMGERISDAKTCRTLLKRILENYRIPYVTVTPTFSICPKHGYISGEHKFCPLCDEELIELKRRQACAC